MESSKHKKEVKVKTEKQKLNEKIMKSMRKFLLEYNRNVKDELVHAPSRMRKKALLKYFENNVTTRKSKGGNVEIRTFKHKKNGFSKTYEFKVRKPKTEKKTEKKPAVKRRKKKEPKQRNPRTKAGAPTKKTPTTKKEYLKAKKDRDEKIKDAHMKLLEEQQKKAKKKLKDFNKKQKQLEKNK